MKSIDVQMLSTWFKDGNEIALLDAREERAFTDDGHILLASSAPLSRLELIVGDLVPQRSTRIVFCDAGDGEAARAASRLEQLGYQSVHYLDGGTLAWEGEGKPLYRGIYVPSKAFAEVVEHDAATPYITPETLAAWQSEDKNVAIFDTRTYEEYHANTIPGSVSMPGAEIVYQVPAMVNDPETTIVVNCGGRTRSIIGAQALINAGVKNKVVSLKDGTMGWHLAGLDVAQGETKRGNPPPASDIPALAKKASNVAQAFGVVDITLDDLTSLRARGAGTVYVLDVRSPDEFAAGHLPDSRSAPGGQLVQETDRHIAVWGAQVVLIDTDGVRARMTGSWLAQMGWDVSALTVTQGDLKELGGPAPTVLSAPNLPGDAFISPESLAKRVNEPSVRIVDLSLSRTFRDEHLPGAMFTVRARFRTWLEQHPDDEVVLTSDDGLLAQFAWADHRDSRIKLLNGGNRAWRASGGAFESGMDNVFGPVDDCWYTPRDRTPEEREAAMVEYLTWEANLVNDMRSDELQRFRGVRSL